MDSICILEPLLFSNHARLLLNDGELPIKQSSQRRESSTASYPIQRTHVPTGRIPPLPLISQYTAVLRSSLNATGSHRRSSPCANSGGVDARTIISVGQHSFVAYLGIVTAPTPRDWPEPAEKNSLLVSGPHLFNLIDRAHVSAILSIYVFL